MSEGLPILDEEALIARVRADRAQGGEEAMAELYRRLFGTPLGRLGLAHFLALCGIGARKGANMSPDARSFLDGREDAAIELMTLAGFDEASLVVAVMTDQLEGQTHGTATADVGSGGSDEPEPEF